MGTLPGHRPLAVLALHCSSERRFRQAEREVALYASMGFEYLRHNDEHLHVHIVDKSMRTTHRFVLSSAALSPGAQVHGALASRRESESEI